MTDFEDQLARSGTTRSRARSTSTRPSAANFQFKNEAGKEYKLNDKIATLQIRPRLAPDEKARHR